MAQTAGRCSTESEDGVACPGCTCGCSRLYCIECRNRTGNILSAAIGCRTFKRAECVRHAQGFHLKERGSHSVPTLLTKEAEKVKQNRVRTILASTAPTVGLMSSSKYGLLLLKTAANRPPTVLVLCYSDSGYRGPLAGQPPQAPGGWQGEEREMRRGSGSLSGQMLGL